MEQFCNERSPADYVMFRRHQITNLVSRADATETLVSQKLTFEGAIKTLFRSGFQLLLRFLADDEWKCFTSRCSLESFISVVYKFGFISFSSRYLRLKVDYF